jgi:hypothetical protein
MKKLLLILMFLPLLLIAQTPDKVIQEPKTEAQEPKTSAQQTLVQNNTLIAQFAQLAPMGINPYAAVFLTSLCSKMGFHNSFVATNPFFNSWIVVILFGSLFLFTISVGTIFKTNKVTAPIALADNYLSNYAALVINAFIMIAPAFLSTHEMDNKVVYEAGFLSISFKTALILFVSMYFLIVFMCVRFFIDILIYLSPIPFIDSVLEIFKLIATVGFVLISIISPMLTVLISIVMFLVCLIIYRRAIRLADKMKYLVIYPILNLFRSKEKVLTNGQSFSILAFTGKKTNKIKHGKIVRLEKQADKFYLTRKYYFFETKDEITFEDCFIIQNHLNMHIKNASGTKHLILNRSYNSYVNDMAEITNIPINKKAEFKLNLNKGFFGRIKSMFSKKDISELKSV